MLYALSSLPVDFVIYRGLLFVIYACKMATREVRNKLGKQRQYRKARNRSECNETEQSSSMKKRMKMDPDYVEKWDAAALKVTIPIG